MPKQVEDVVPMATAITLPELQKVLGEPNPAVAAVVLEGATEADLVIQGRLIASRHIVSDMRRIYAGAYDFWSQAGEPQKKRLRGFSPALLSVAVSRALRLEDMMAGHTDRTDTQGTSRDAREQEAREAFSSAITLRDQAVQVLRGVAGQHSTLLAEVEVAAGTAETPEKLAAGVGRLAKLGAKWLETKKGPLFERARVMQLDAGYVDELNQAATHLKNAAEKATARSGGGKVTQGALDAEDGANLLLLGHIVHAFEAAHDLDPTIPRLVPIATRRLLGPSRTKPASKVEPAAPVADTSTQPS